MITAAGSELGPGGIGPGATIRTGCADSGGRGQGQHRVGLGDGGPGPAVAWPSPWPSSLYASAASSSARQVMLRFGHGCSTYLVALAQSDITQGSR
jgi:hypothetical protein